MMGALAPTSAVSTIRRRALVVDDEADSCAALAKALATDGFAVATANSGEAALAEAKRFRPDVVITDLHMAPMSGIELCRRLHEIDGELPVIVVTAHSDMDSVIESLRAGAEDYLLKPLHYEMVLHCTERACDRREARLERARFARAINEQLVLTSLREQAYAEGEALHRAQVEALLEALDEGVAIVDPTGRIVFINAAACTILDVERSDVDALAALDADGAERPLLRLLRGEHFAEYEVVRVRPNGERRSVSTTGTSVRDANGAVALAIVVFRDVTDTKRIEAHREEYTALISHDLRNPLTTIVMFIAMLKSSLEHAVKGEANPYRPEVLLDLAKRADGNAKRMTAMLEELTEATSLESKGVELHRTRCDVGAIVASVVSRMGDAPASRVHVAIDDSAHVVLADSARLDRVATNLLTNALKYSADDAPVDVRVTRIENDVELCVVDRGIGIAPEHLTKLFERYYRTRAGKARAGGLGLGLYIVRSIVEAHGGRIEVSSELGKGSTFRVVIPADVT